MNKISETKKLKLGQGALVDLCGDFPSKTRRIG